MRYISPRGVELVGPIGRTTLKCALCRQKAHSRPQHPCLRSYERAAESASRSVTQHDSSSEQRDIQVPVGTDTLSFPKSSSSSSGTRNSWTIWFGTSSGASAVRVSDGVHSILRSMERARRLSARTRAPSAPASSTTTTGRGTCASRAARRPSTCEGRPTREMANCHFLGGDASIERSTPGLLSSARLGVRNVFLNRRTHARSAANCYTLGRQLLCRSTV